MLFNIPPLKPIHSSEPSEAVILSNRRFHSPQIVAKLNFAVIWDMLQANVDRKLNDVVHLGDSVQLMRHMASFVQSRFLSQLLFAKLDPLWRALSHLAHLRSELSDALKASFLVFGYRKRLFTKLLFLRVTGPDLSARLLQELQLIRHNALNFCDLKISALWLLCRSNFGGC